MCPATGGLGTKTELGVMNLIRNVPCHTGPRHQDGSGSHVSQTQCALPHRAWAPTWGRESRSSDATCLMTQGLGTNMELGVTNLSAMCLVPRVLGTNVGLGITILGHNASSHTWPKHQDGAGSRINQKQHNPTWYLGTKTRLGVTNLRQNIPCHTEPGHQDEAQNQESQTQWVLPHGA